MEAVNPKYTKKIQNLYKLERQYENLLDEHQEIREDQEIEEEELLSDCIKLAEELPKRECLNFDNQYIKIHSCPSTVVCWHLDRWE
jgi:hypothetical protein